MHLLHKGVLVLSRSSQWRNHPAIVTQTGYSFSTAADDCSFEPVRLSSPFSELSPMKHGGGRKGAFADVALGIPF